MTTPDRDITKLDPSFKRKVDLFLSEVEIMGVFVTEAFRTKERQAELIEQRLSKVAVSNHQLGLAIDIGFKDDLRTSERETELYPNDYRRWREVADIANKYEIDWGYDLWNWDMPHFQDNGEKLKDSKAITDNEKILAKRMEKAWKELDEANATKKYLHELKGTPYKPYIIIEDNIGL